MIAQMNQKFGPGKSSSSNTNSEPRLTGNEVAPLSKIYFNSRKYKFLKNEGTFGKKR